jgi:hypothetical protein
MDYKWTNEAYAKVAFHASKFLMQSVTGLLLGDVSKSTVEIIDSIPLFHSQILTPTMEMALLSVDDYATKHTLKIIGIYTASSINVTANDSIPQLLLTSKIALKLKEFFEPAFIFLADEKITQSASAPSGKLLTSGSDGLFTKDATQNAIVSESLHAFLAKSFKSQLYRSLSDYEEYIDDPSHDWTNATLFPKDRKE